MSASQLRVLGRLSRQMHVPRRAFSTSPRLLETASTATPTQENAVAANSDASSVAVTQSPNRTGIWAPSQQPRSKAMTGPRFEQTDFSLQPQPFSAIELVHQQPVRWTHDQIVMCDGGSGPAGHPRIFINTDKPEIATCNYCGTPYANEHHRKHLESLPKTSYPLA